VPVALWVVLYLEYWELAPPAESRRPPGIHGHWGNHFPDYRTYSYREYGNRIGFFRVLETLDRYGIPATVAANAVACHRYPHLVDHCLRRNWELVPHGTHATRMITSRMSQAEERDTIAQSIEAVRSVTGETPSGWIGQDCNESTRTPHLLAEAGLRWVSDWPNDDQPFLTTTKPPLVSLPQQPEWDDVQLLWVRQIATPRYPQIIADALSRLQEDGRSTGRVLGLGVHPWLFGQPHRIAYLDRTLAALAASPLVWKAGGSEIVEAFMKSARSGEGE
jgi:peptidoglycan/xylan/chitin deacetylase (PgdA/CDA1 family)